MESSPHMSAISPKDNSHMGHYEIIYNTQKYEQILQSNYCTMSKILQLQIVGIKN